MTELDDLRAEVMELRADLGAVERWQGSLSDGTGTVRVRAVAVCDPRGTERVLLGCAEDHETPAEAGECADSFGVEVRTALGRNGFAVSTDDDQPVVNLWRQGNIAVSIGSDGIRRYGPDEQTVPATVVAGAGAAAAAVDPDDGTCGELVERAEELVHALRTDADDLAGTIERARSRTGGATGPAAGGVAMRTPDRVILDAIERMSTDLRDQAGAHARQADKLVAEGETEAAVRNERASENLLDEADTLDRAAAWLSSRPAEQPVQEPAATGDEPGSEPAGADRPKPWTADLDDEHRQAHARYRQAVEALERCPGVPPGVLSELDEAFGSVWTAIEEETLRNLVVAVENRGSSPRLRYAVSTRGAERVEVDECDHRSLIQTGRTLGRGELPPMYELGARALLEHDLGHHEQADAMMAQGLGR